MYCFSGCGFVLWYRCFLLLHSHISWCFRVWWTTSVQCDSWSGSRFGFSNCKNVSTRTLKRLADPSYDTCNWKKHKDEKTKKNKDNNQVQKNGKAKTGKKRARRNGRRRRGGVGEGKRERNSRGTIKQVARLMSSIVSSVKGRTASLKIEHELMKCTLLQTTVFTISLTSLWLPDIHI